MEPHVRYVRSRDGTRIAVWTLGEGRPLVFVQGVWFVSIESHWQIPEIRRNMERLAQQRTIVQYDNRGQGLSEREVDDFSLGARVDDLAAVIDSLQARPVDLIGLGFGSLIAPAYVAAHSDKVRRLVLRDPAAHGRDFETPPVRGALRGVLDLDWATYVQMNVLLDFGWTEVGRQVAEASVGTIAPDILVNAQSAAIDYDIAELLPMLRCPTLAVYRRGSEFLDLTVAKRVAASIPNARLVTVESRDPLFLVEESQIRVVEAFLDEDTARAEPDLPSGTAIILFADVADSTALTERLGDAAFRAKARELDGALRTVIRENGGTCIDAKTLGDGVLAVFTSARQAIGAALACGKAGDEAGLPLHLGLHAGDVIREENNVYGGAVNIAARISGLSAPGEVLVSETVRSLARTSAGVAFDDRGEQTLKGVGEPVRVWAVREGTV